MPRSQDHIDSLSRMKRRWIKVFNNKCAHAVPVEERKMYLVWLFNDTFLPVEDKHNV